jgi:glycosyltransferase involved in cell wall biosynthesis
MVRPSQRPVKPLAVFPDMPAPADAPPAQLAALREQIDLQARELSDLRWELANLRAYYGGFRFRAVDRINDLLWKLPGLHRLVKSGAVALSAALRLLDGAERAESDLTGGAGVFCEGLSAEQSQRVLAAARSKPLISIIVPVYKVDPRWLARCLDCVAAQHYQRWELVAIDDGSQSPEITRLLQERAAADPRIRTGALEKNGGICVATNAGLEMARGEFIGFLDHDDELTPDALAWIVAMHNRFPHAVWFYSDEDKISEQGTLSVPFFKPDYSPEYLLSVMYTCHFSVYSAELLRQAGGVRPGFEGSQDHDLALRLSERVAPEQVVHIPRILYHWRTVSTSTAVNEGAKPYASIAGCKAVREALARRGLEGSVTPHPVIRTVYQIHLRPKRQPHVTVIVPTRNAADMLKECLASVRRHTQYASYEVLVIDNQSDEPKLADYLAGESAASRLRVIGYDRPFNHSQMHNEAVAALASEYIVLLNNDVVIQSDAWLEQLVATAEIDPKVAGVGALLLYPDGTIQHGGIILGVQGTAGHSHRDLDGEHLGYGGRPQLLHESFGATAALLLLRRSAFLEVDGFDATHYPTSYNDVDLWLRLRAAGYRCLYNPQVRAIHHELKTRRVSADLERQYRRQLRDDWLDHLEHDPFYNPNLTLANEQYRGLRPYPVAADFPELSGEQAARGAA